MSKITPDHLTRGAIVYVRQSTAHQVMTNLESQRRQYGLVERARQLGWADVQVVDDDLGKSGGGTARPGFEKLLAAICEGTVGAVLSIEASRLARNGRDWHTLLEFCGLVDALIIDEDGVYDPRSPNDRLLLGMKGTMSEMELSIFRQRSLEAIRQKARRGEMFSTVAVGYVKIDDGGVEKDPDQRVQEAIALVFQKFAELQSISQVHRWFVQENIPLPAIVPGPKSRALHWKAPGYDSLHHMLTNPIYAGSYAFGRRGTRTTLDRGRKRIVRHMRRDWKDWEVLLHDRHEGYISWGEFERNHRLITDNANRWSDLGRGSVRQGEALLTGLLRCARCGRKLYVAYSGDGGRSCRYACQGGHRQDAMGRCISFGGARVDRAVAQEVLARLQPLGIEAALAAMEADGKDQSDRRRQLENALDQARYEAGRAQRQYDAIDPENRLVAGELERRWNEKLTHLRKIQDELDHLATKPSTSLTDLDRTRLMGLGKDLERAWDSPGATVETRKKIIRLLIAETIVDVQDDKLDLVIHWQGGDHTRLAVQKGKVGRNRWATNADVVDLVRVLARQMPDRSTAAVLNRAGKTTGKGNGWTHSAVCTLRNQHKIAPHRDGERAERGEVTMEEAAVILAVSTPTIRRMINTGTLPAQQLCKGAPWVIRSADLQCDAVRRDANARRSRKPQSENQLQQTLEI